MLENKQASLKDSYLEPIKGSSALYIFPSSNNESRVSLNTICTARLDSPDLLPSHVLSLVLPLGPYQPLAERRSSPTVCFLPFLTAAACEGIEVYSVKGIVGTLLSNQVFVNNESAYLPI